MEKVTRYRVNYRRAKDGELASWKQTHELTIATKWADDYADNRFFRVEVIDRKQNRTVYDSVHGPIEK